MDNQYTFAYPVLRNAILLETFHTKTFSPRHLPWVQEVKV